HVDSFEEGEIIGDSVLNNDGCVKDCMKKDLDDDVEKDIEDCSKNVTEKCGAVNNNMSNNVEGEILEDHFDGDRRNDTIEDNADVNPSTNVYLDVSQNTSIPEVVEDLSSLDRTGMVETTNNQKYRKEDLVYGQFLEPYLKFSRPHVGPLSGISFKNLMNYNGLAAEHE
nr:hypothetical protein CTI12_AA509060 [Tanacetum cinerariifolium]